MFKLLISYKMEFSGGKQIWIQAAPWFPKGSHLISALLSSGFNKNNRKFQSDFNNSNQKCFVILVLLFNKPRYGIMMKVQS